MKKGMLTTAFLLLFGVVLFAQQERNRERPSPEVRAKMMTDRMAEKLELSEAQKQKVLEINLEYAKKRESEMQERKAQSEIKKAELQEQDAKIMEVLTEEQRKQWVEMKEQRVPGRRPGGAIEDRSEFRKRRGGGN